MDPFSLLFAAAVVFGGAFVRGYSGFGSGIGRGALTRSGGCPFACQAIDSAERPFPRGRG